MLNLRVFIFLIICFNVYLINGQSKLLLEMQLIDYSNYQIKTQIDSLNPINSKIYLKNEYNYIDSIKIFKIKYKSDNLLICGLLILPKKAGKYPSIIYNRGGNQDFGELTIAKAIQLGKYASKGYVVIASNYRGNKCSGGMDEFGGGDVQDVSSLINVLNEIEYADTSRVAMYGWSRGGMMTFIALKNNPRIKTIIVGGGLIDLFESAEYDKNWEANVLANLIPDYYNNKENELSKRSVISWACDLPLTCSILLLHGEEDSKVPVSQTLRLSNELSKCNIINKVEVVKGGDHGLTKFRPLVDALIIEWLEKNLR